MNFNVLIGPVYGGYRGVQAIVYKDSLPPEMRKVNPAESEMLERIKRHLGTKFYQEDGVSRVACRLRWRIDKTVDEATGVFRYVTSSIYLEVKDEGYREFGREVFSHCHRLFPFDKLVKNRSHLSMKDRGAHQEWFWNRGRKPEKVGWDETSAAAWGRELDRKDRKRRKFR